MTSAEQQPPRLPPPDRIKRLRDIIDIESDNLYDLRQVSLLARSLFDHPDVDHHFYFVEGKPNELLVQAIKRSELDISETDRHYYRHPKRGFGFVQIHPNKTEWDWEREVVAKGPTFVRATVVLTSRTKRAFEEERHVEIVRRALEKNAGTPPPRSAADDPKPADAEAPRKWDDPERLRASLDHLGRLDGGSTLSVSEINRLFGLDRRRISDWKGAGRLVVVKEDDTPARVLVSSLVDNLKRRLREVETGCTRPVAPDKPGNPRISNPLKSPRR